MSQGMAYPPSSVIALNITRAQIAATAIAVTTFMVGGYATHGDLGSGAVYTSQGANSSSTGAIQDAAGTWFKLVINGVIKPGWFGVKADGTTDDTTALAAAFAAIPSTGSFVELPAGKIQTSGGLTLSNPFILKGAGNLGIPEFESPPQSGGSQILCNSATAYAITVTATEGLFTDLSIINNAGSTPSAGAGIYVNDSTGQSKIDDIRVTVNGFYDNVLRDGGSSWRSDAAFYFGAVRYGLHIKNTALPDYGDWWVTNGSFSGRSSVSTACIAIESSGGGKILGNKFNAGWGGSATYGIYVNMSASSQLWIRDNSFDSIAASQPIYIANGRPYFNIGQNYIALGSSTTEAIYGNGIGGGLIDENIIVGNNAASAGIVLNNTNSILVMPQRISGYSSTTVSFTGSTSGTIVDLSQIRQPVTTGVGPFSPYQPSTQYEAQQNANEAVATYFQVQYPVTISNIRFAVGTQSGNIDVGLYKLVGSTVTKIATAGSFACPAAGVHNQALGSSVTLYPGTLYYFAWAADNTTATLLCSRPTAYLDGSFYDTQRTGTAFPLPATLAFLATSLNAPMMFGL